MAALGFHLRLRFMEDRVFAGTRAERCALAALVFRADHHQRVLTFRAADTHLHFAFLSNQEECLQFSRCVAIALQKQFRYGTPLQPPRLKAFNDIHHLASTFHYILDQERHHHIRIDPLSEASNLPDLTGLRLGGRYACDLLASHLPRVTMADLLGHLGVRDLTPPGLDPRFLLPSASAAIGRVALTRNAPACQQARAAAAHLGRNSLQTRVVAEHLCMDGRSVRRLAALHVPPALVEAVRRQVALRTRLAEGGTDVLALDQGSAAPLPTESLA